MCVSSSSRCRHGTDLEGRKPLVPVEADMAPLEARQSRSYDLFIRIPRAIQLLLPAVLSGFVQAIGRQLFILILPPRGVVT